MSTLRRGDTSTLSLREKTLVKRRITKEHNSNFRAGYVHIDEEQLHKTGIRGRKTYFICCLTISLALLVLINLLITLTIFATLKISKNGMSALEFIPRSVLLRFLGDSDMGDVYPATSTIGSLPYDNLDVSGNSSNPVVLRVTRSGEPEVSIGPSKISIDQSELFMVIDPDTGQTVFTTEYVENMPMPDDVRNLDVKKATVNKIQSAKDSDLTLDGGKASTTVRGSTGITSQSSSVHMQADKYLSMDAEKGIHLLGAKSIYFKKPKDLPLVDDRGRPPTDEKTYKICVVMPSGQLHLVEAPGSCQDLNQK